VPELEIWERPPSMLRNVNGGPLGGGDEVPGACIINARNIDDEPLGPRGGGGSGLHPGSERCVVNCIDMIDKK
jgi:hypothetical protein